MKKNNEGLKMDVIRFGTEDIITASVETDSEPAPDNPGITYQPVAGSSGVYLGSDGNYYVLVDGKYVNMDDVS